jgi:hypothetical protein
MQTFQLLLRISQLFILSFVWTTVFTREEARDITVEYPLHSDTQTIMLFQAEDCDYQAIIHAAAGSETSHQASDCVFKDMSSICNWNHWKSQMN